MYMDITSRASLVAIAISLIILSLSHEVSV